VAAQCHVEPMQAVGRAAENITGRLDQDKVAVPTPAPTTDGPRTLLRAA
jgi:hypothetical protein